MDLRLSAGWTDITTSQVQESDCKKVAAVRDYCKLRSMNMTDSLSSAARAILQDEKQNKSMPLKECISWNAHPNTAF